MTEVETMMEVDEEDTEKEALWREMENLYQRVLNFRQDLRQEVGERLRCAYGSREGIWKKCTEWKDIP